MVSEVSICNQALSWLGASPIISLDDNSVEARLCKANYAHLRDTVLADTEWSFAVCRETWPRLASQTVDNHNIFALPVYCLRVLQVWDMNGNEIEWLRECDGIIADRDLIIARFIKRVTDPNRFSFHFIQALAARIAADLAIGITRSRSMFDDMLRVYQLKLDEAAAVDGLQGRTQVITNKDLIRVR